MLLLWVTTDTLLLWGTVLCVVVNTMTEYEITETLDVTGQNCPMPVVKTKQNIDKLGAGAVLEVLATDPGSMSDIAGWAETTDGVELIDQNEGEAVFTHYVRKTA
jgi:tRNA 2-thiouridine synthesizing protein A